MILKHAKFFWFCFCWCLSHKKKERWRGRGRRKKLHTHTHQVEIQEQWHVTNLLWLLTVCYMIRFLEHETKLYRMNTMSKIAFSPRFCLSFNPYHGSPCLWSLEPCNNFLEWRTLFLNFTHISELNIEICCFPVTSSNWNMPWRPFSIPGFSR